MGLGNRFKHGLVVLLVTVAPSLVFVSLSEAQQTVRTDCVSSLGCAVGQQCAIGVNAAGGICLGPTTGTTVSATQRGVPSKTNPSIANATSATLVAANANRQWLMIQNNSAANICFSIANATLTGIVPSGTNVCDVLTPGSSFSSPPQYSSTSAVTIYQTSGAAITSISVTEG